MLRLMQSWKYLMHLLFQRLEQDSWIYLSRTLYTSQGNHRIHSFIVRDVWAFLLTCNVQYCSLYGQGYTSIWSIYDTVPNALLCISDSANSKENFRPEYHLPDGRLERAGSAKKCASTCENISVLCNGPNSVDCGLTYKPHSHSISHCCW